MKKFWSHVSAFLLGAVGALLLVLQMKKPEQVVNYTIGKVKNKGDGNSVAVKLRGIETEEEGLRACREVSSESSEEKPTLKSQSKRKNINRPRKRGLKIRKK